MAADQLHAVDGRRHRRRSRGTPRRGSRAADRRRASRSIARASRRGHDGRGGIVRRADDHGLGPRRHPALHVLEIRLVAVEWARHDRGAGRGSPPCRTARRPDEESRPRRPGRRRRGRSARAIRPPRCPPQPARRGTPSRSPSAARSSRRSAIRVEMRARGFAADAPRSPAGRGREGSRWPTAASDRPCPDPSHGLERLARIVGSDLVQDRTPEPSHRRLIVQARLGTGRLAPSSRHV